MNFNKSFISFLFPVFMVDNESHQILLYEDCSNFVHKCSYCPVQPHLKRERFEKELGYMSFISYNT